MKVEEKGSTKMVEFPLDETDRIMDAMEQAEKAGDLKALQWCARRLQWLWQEGDVISTDKYWRVENLFNTAWAALSKNDPAPESISAIVNRADEPDPITVTDAGKALDTVKAFLEEALRRKKYRAVMDALDALDILGAALKAVESEE